MKKKKRTLCARITRFCTCITILSVIAWVALFNINNMLGATSASAGKPEDELFKYSNEPKKDNVSLLFAGVDKDGLRTDSIIYAKYDTINNKLYMMSIPRDTYTDHKYATNKINTIYRGGKYTNEFIEEIEELLDVNIDYYAVINLKVVSDVVDAIGGINITLEDDVWKLDKKTGKWNLAFPKGEQTLNAKQVETLIRNRDYKDGDLSRGKMQRTVITALIKNLVSTKTLTKLLDIKDIVLENTNTNVTVREAMKYLSEIKEVDLKNIVSTNMPLLDINYVVDGTACVLVNKEKAREIIKEEWVYTPEETNNETLNNEQN